MPLQMTFEHVRGSRSGKSDVVDRESILIGRGDGNDVILDAFQDPTVSAQHAEVRLENGEVVLYDMGSLNGTFLNGVSVRRAELHQGDQIALGRQGPLLRVDLGQVGGTGSVRQVRIPDLASGRGGSTVSEQVIRIESHVDSDSMTTHTALFFMLLGALAVSLVALVLDWI